MDPVFWKQGNIILDVNIRKPLLACWEANSHPAQIRMNAYLEDMAALAAHLTEPDLFLHLDVGLDNPANLIHHHDLENYLTPLVNKLGHARFVLASATKKVAETSRLIIGRAVKTDPPPAQRSFHTRMGPGAGSKEWKAELRRRILEQNPMPLPPGGVEVQIAISLAPHRNWVSAWKPIGDAMGPILGEPDPRNPFNPNDDRITCIAFHKSLDQTVSNDTELYILATAP